MTTAVGNKKTRLKLGSIAASTALVALLSVSIVGTFNNAEAVLVPLQEHWKYNVQWIWDEDIHRTVGIISPKIVIQNETIDRIEGYIADQNGTRLTMYDGQQLVMVRYGYDDGRVSKWEMDSWIHDGFFAINIPEAYKDANILGMYIGNHEYTVDNGTPVTPQSKVFINSARLDYHRTNSTLTQIQATQPIEPQINLEPLLKPSPGSLIDLILSRYGLLATTGTRL